MSPDTRPVVAGEFGQAGDDPSVVGDAAVVGILSGRGILDTLVHGVAGGTKVLAGAR
ncbi:hypothetical protein [Paractinoplanes rishiriensis]|uniref:Uncharacterized protein n=1 Tax=Paractinoplanes rishiriensis TaxID=1050105 RepID=A0A919MWB2_9ACTN|nr:hypothetical protein [Actinoplanes rishiriensis]GIF02307.1 hypothetical protein Ari01nite_97710 [Actinoplanes rishiriensis]